MMISVGSKFTFNKFRIYIDYQFDATINHLPAVGTKLDHRVHIFITKKMSSDNLSWFIKFVAACERFTQYNVIIHIPKWCTEEYIDVSVALREALLQNYKIIGEPLSHCSIFAKNKHEVLVIQANKFFKKYYYQWATLERSDIK